MAPSDQRNESPMPTLAAVVLISLLATQAGFGDEYRIDRRSQWLTWRAPEGALELRGDGSLELGWYGGRTDPLDDMRQFEHATRTQGVVSGGITAYSNQSWARRLHDDNASTWWQPDPDDGLENWWIHVDLGRIVLLEKIRLVFPDTAGARPFEDFSVYVSEGITVSPSRDVYRFHKVATTTRPNRERELEYDLITIDPSGGGSPAEGKNMVVGDTLRFRPIQHVRFVPHKLTPDAALAELELVAIGDDIALGTVPRGGSIRAGKSLVEAIFDGTADIAWNPAASRVAEAFWQVGGNWFEWDLGATFWLDRIVIFSAKPTEVGWTTYYTGSSALGYDLSVSDGTSAMRSEEAFRGPYDYTQISFVTNTAQPRRWIFDHQFHREKARYVWWNHDLNTGSFGFMMFEAFLYGEGYPAAATLESDFIDLGAAKNLTAVSWEADLPPATAVQVQTRTGEELATSVRYFHKNGTEVTAQKYHNKLFKTFRGDTLVVFVEGPDWSSWSEPHRVSGEAFRSPTPRRYLRMRLDLLTEDPQVTPVLHSLSVQYRDALVQKGIEAEILPREAEVGQWQEFSYHLRPTYTAGDRGFDGVSIPVPAPARQVSVTLGTAPLDGFNVSAAGDTLVIDFGQRVLRDSVVVRFTTRPLEDPTRFAAAVTNSSQEGNVQEVRPAHREALQVFLPDVSAGADYISNLSLAAPVVTPNGDGINDQLRLTFDLLRAAVVPSLQILDLGGRPVRTLTGREARAQEITWDGTYEGGAPVPPGVYLLRVEVRAEADTEVAVRLVTVAY